MLISIHLKKVSGHNNYKVTMKDPQQGQPDREGHQVRDASDY